jgi:hypothetical protein
MKDRILLLGFVFGLVATAVSTGRGENRFWFRPNMITVEPGESFEWHLWMDNDFQVYGYTIYLNAPEEAMVIFNPDTLYVNWNGTAADSYLDNLDGSYERTLDVLWASAYDFAGSGVPLGSHIGVKIQGTISETAPDGIYTFSGDFGNCYFRDEFGGLILVDVAPGYLDVRHDCGDVNSDGRVTVADATYIVSYIYRGGPAPCNPTPERK